MNADLWKNRRVLVTGHTGFKGSWLCKWLDMMGAEVLGIALRPDGLSPYHKLTFSARVREAFMNLACDDELGETVRAFEPEVVFHLAAQAIVGKAYEDPVTTFESNVMGTVRLLDVLKACSRLRAVVAVTSDKVYENRELGRPFVEGDRLGADEPYSASKSCQELVVRAYAGTYWKNTGVKIATARGSNVYGGGDYHYERLIPGLINHVLNGEKPEVRNPGAVRPWQYVLCLLEGYLCLAERLLEESLSETGIPDSTRIQTRYSDIRSQNSTVTSCRAYAGGWNFGPAPEECVTVGSVASMIAQEIISADSVNFYEAGILCLDAGKSARELGWRVRVPLDEGITLTREFYRRERLGESTDNLMKEELERYAALCED